jgi:hypothetical protein
MEPLTTVAARHRIDYFKLRSLVIRGTVKGALVNGRWMCENRSAAKWKAAETEALRARLATEPAPA